jgi:Uma2 family endonuclease
MSYFGNERTYLTPEDHGRLIALNDFLSASGQEGYRYEIIGGRVEVWPFPSLPHEELRDWLGESLRGYARSQPSIIQRVKSPARVFLPTGEEGATAPEPDIACYRVYPSIPLEDRD